MKKSLHYIESVYFHYQSHIVSLMQNVGVFTTNFIDS